MTNSETMTNQDNPHKTRTLREVKQDMTQEGSDIKIKHEIIQQNPKVMTILC